jgi:hypothetical protein
MTIASVQFEDIGPHWPVSGPFSSGSFPAADFKPGTVVAGDNGAEFIYLTLNVVTGYTANQGDFYAWDHNMVASRTGEIAVASAYDVGMNVGTIFFGGKTGDNTGGVGPWSVVFVPGTYGVWVQRAGISLANINATTNFTTAAPADIGGTAGRITFVTALTTKSNPMPIGSVAFMPTSKTFTADTLAGTTTLLNVSNGRVIQKGMVLTGSGIPGTTTAPVTTIIDINGATVTMSAAATATATGVTVTALTNSTSGTTVNGSPIISNVPTVIGMYPNANIIGTGLVSSAILSITGSNGNYSILTANNATATSAAGVFVSFTTTAMPNYNEVFLSWPYYSAVTSA